MTNEGKAWKELAGNLMLKYCKYKKLISKPMAVSVDMFLKYDRDIDSSLKLLLDAMEGVIYHDDKLVNRLLVTKQKDSEEPRLEVEVCKN